MKNDPDPLREPRFEKLVAGLRAQPAPEPSAGFTERTLARARRQPARPGAAWFLLPRVAAALALLGAAGWWLARGPAHVAPTPGPAALLLAAQRPDGGWSADDQHRRVRYDPSVTALALLALMKTGDAPLQGPHARAIRAGVDHLLRQQQADGRFGGDFSGAGFTQYLAGMALQAAARLPGADPAWIMAAARAAPHLPSGVQMAKLNHSLAHPEHFPPRWAEAGGPVTQAALQMLGR